MDTFIGICVENYSESKNFTKVRYAENDVRAFSATLQLHGFAIENQVILINENATKSRVESTIRTILQSLSAADRLFMYFAGHGVYISGMNCLVVHDSMKKDLAFTSVVVGWVFDQVRESECKKVVMFLDACHSGVVSDAGSRDIIGELDETGIQNFFSSAEHCVCFAACKVDQISRSCDTLEHGVWTYHLLQAFNGHPSAHKNGLLTDATLKNYLREVVPAEARKVRPDAIQTPWCFGGSSSEILLADLRPLLERRKAQQLDSAQNYSQLKFIHSYIERVDYLSGFNRKMHFVPKKSGLSEQMFLEQIIGDEIREPMKEAASVILNKFGYKRKELQVDTENNTYAEISTPDFTFSRSVSYLSQDPGRVEWIDMLEKVRDWGKANDAKLLNCFDSGFTQVHLSIVEKVHLSELLDELEEIGDPRYKLHFDVQGEPEKFKAYFSHLKATLEFQDDSIVCSVAGRTAPEKLVELLKSTRSILVDELDVQSLVFPTVE